MIRDDNGKFVWGGWLKPYQYLMEEGIEESIGTFGMVMAIRLHKCGQKHRMAIKGAIRDLESFGSKIDHLLFDAKSSLDHLAAALLLHESFIKNDPKMAAEVENHFNKAFYAIRDFIVLVQMESRGKADNVSWEKATAIAQMQSQYPVAVKIEKFLVDLKNCTKTMRVESVEEADAVTEARRAADADHIYFKSFTAALDYARAKAEKRGYQIDEDDWNTRVTHGFPVVLRSVKPRRSGSISSRTASP